MSGVLRENLDALQRERDRWRGDDDASELAPPRPVGGPLARIVVAEDDRILGDAGRVDADRVRSRFRHALSALTGLDDEAACWRRLLTGWQPGQTIGLKLNTVAVHLVPHSEVLSAIIESLASLGIESSHVVLWDNLGRLGPVRRRLYGDVTRPEGSYYQGMERAGLRPRRSGAPRIMCTVPRPPGMGYDRKVRAKIPSAGLELPVARILTRICDHVINIAVPKDHRITGMTCALKNFYGSVPLWDALRPVHADRMHANHGNPLYAVASRVLYTWIYNNTGRSVFAVALFNAMANLSWQLFPNNGSHFDPQIAGLVVTAIALLIATVWGPRTLTRHGIARPK